MIRAIFSSLHVVLRAVVVAVCVLLVCTRLQVDFQLFGEGSPGRTAFPHPWPSLDMGLPITTDWIHLKAKNSVETF